jgi:proteasome accessory factor B
MQKAQRLLDLAAFLLKAAEPVSWREIQEQFPDDYAGTGEAAIRKFERDKADLVDLGIPVRYVAGDEDLAAGYLIEKDEFYLPDLKLPPEDLALLYLAGSAALAKGTFPYARDLAHALNKLSFAARAPGASEAAAIAARALSTEKAAPWADPAAVARTLEELSRAIAHRKRVHLVYVDARRRERTERDVDAYGLYQRDGAWFLSGWCHLRKALRTFHLGRIESLAVNPAAPRTPDFEPRPDFSLAAEATRDPWNYGEHAPVRCRVRLDASAPAEARASFGATARIEEDGGAAVVELQVTNRDALLRHVLSLGDAAEVLAPRALRERAREMLAGLARGLA